MVAMAMTEEMERLGRALARKAEQRRDFIGYAIALWRDANPNGRVEEHLGCPPNAIWRLAVTPRPDMGQAFTETVMQVAQAHGANPATLIKLLRRADVVGAMRGAGDGEGMLKAALDVEPGEPG